MNQSLSINGIEEESVMVKCISPRSILVLSVTSQSYPLPLLSQIIIYIQYIHLHSSPCYSQNNNNYNNNLKNPLIRQVTMNSGCRQDLPVAPLKFFKIILDPKANCLRIPPEFTKRYGHNLPNRVFLKVPTGQKTQVQLVRCDKDNTVMLQKGWQEFKDLYSVGFGHLLVFVYNGDSEFNVFIFDVSAVEIDYPLFDKEVTESGNDSDYVVVLEDYYSASKKRKGKAKSHENANKGHSSSCDNNVIEISEDYHVKKSLRRKRDISSHLKKESRSELDVDGRETCDAYQKAKDFVSNHMTSNNPNGKEWTLRCHVGDRQAQLTTGWKSFVNENGIKVGDVCVFEVMKNSKGHELVWNVPPSRFFKIILDPQADNLRIPPEFMKRYGHNLPSRVFLKIPNGPSMEAELVQCKSGKTWLKKGWLEFKQLCSIGFGYFLVFEYDKKSQFNVLIFNMSAVEINYPVLEDNVMKSDNGNQENSRNLSSCCFQRKKPSCRVKLEESSNEKCSDMNSAYQKAAAFSTRLKNPFHISVMKHSAVGKGFSLSLPLSFARQNLPREDANLVIMASEGKKWPVKCLMRNSRASLSAGWVGFVKGNGLKLGDACVFEVASHGHFLVFEYDWKSEFNNVLIFDTSAVMNRYLEGPTFELTMNSGYRQDLPMAQLKFFKIILDPKANCLRIPHEFTKNYGHNLPNHVFLKVPTGQKTQVQLVRCDKDNTVVLQKGWQEFKDLYSLGFGHLLVFVYNGESEFNVFIFDVSAVEIDYPLFDKEVTESDNDSDYVVVLEDYYSASKKRKGKAKSQENANKGHSSSFDDVIEISDDYPRTKSLRRKRDISSRLKKESRSELDVDGRETRDAYEKAKDFVSSHMTSNNPFFISVMHKSYVLERYNLAVPYAFARRNLPRVGSNSIVMLTNGKEWNLRCHVGDRRAQLTTGWKSFVKENGIKVGDVCVFEVMKNSKGNELANMLEDVRQPPSRFFKIILDPQADNLRIPPEFMKRYGHNLPSHVFLKAPNGLSMEAELFKCKSGMTWLKKGWLEFKQLCSIGFGYFLVFEYDKKSQFSVLIFDMRAVEINYPVLEDNVMESDDQNQRKPSCRVKLEKSSYEKCSEMNSAYQKAVAFRKFLKNPFHISVMKPSAVDRGFILHLPLPFARKNLPHEDANLVIMAMEGKKWPVKCLMRKGDAFLSAGWVSFVKGNGLKLGDVCVFEVANKGDNKPVWN
ncbi:B3 domain-containing protein, partial [Striga asiatica]